MITIKNDEIILREISFYKNLLGVQISSNLPLKRSKETITEFKANISVKTKERQRLLSTQRQIRSRRSNEQSLVRNYKRQHRLPKWSTLKDKTTSQQQQDLRRILTRTSCKSLRNLQDICQDRLQDICQDVAKILTKILTRSYNNLQD